MKVVTLGEGGRPVVGLFLRADVIGRRRGIGEDHVGLALEEEAVGLRPAFGDRHHARVQFPPRLSGALAIDLPHPKQKTETGSAGPRVLDHHRRSVRILDQILQACRRRLELVGVVDESEVAPIEGNEPIVRPGDRQGELTDRKSCLANRPMAFASAARFMSRPSTTSAFVVSPSSRKRPTRLPASSAVTQARSQAQTASNRSLTVLPGPYFPMKERVAVDGKRRPGLRRSEARANRAQERSERQSFFKCMRSAPGMRRSGRSGKDGRYAMKLQRPCSSLRRHDPDQVQRVGEHRLSALASTP